MPPKKLKEGESPKKPRYDTSPGNPDGYRPSGEWSLTETRTLISSLIRLALENRSTLYTEPALQPWSYNSGDVINAKLKQILIKICKEHEIEMPAPSTNRTPKKRGAANEKDVKTSPTKKNKAEVTHTIRMGKNQDVKVPNTLADPKSRPDSASEDGDDEDLKPSARVNTVPIADDNIYIETSTPVKETGKVKRSVEPEMPTANRSTAPSSPSSSINEEGASSLGSSGRPRRRCTREKNYDLLLRTKEMDDYLRDLDVETDQESQEAEAEAEEEGGDTAVEDGEEGVSDDVLKAGAPETKEAPVVAAI